jgi:general secretion pathway protein H
LGRMVKKGEKVTMLILFIGKRIVSKLISNSYSKKTTIPRFSTGFTLLELIIVMAIMGMIASLVIPHIGSGQQTLLKAKMREAVAVLNYARRAAIVEGKQKVASFYASEENSTAKLPSRNTPSQWVSQGITLQWGEKSKAEKKEEPATEADPASKPIYQITFYPEGGSSGGEIILGYLEHKAVIRVNPLTGKVEAEILDENH